MSQNDNWDVNKYKEEHESDDHWLLRKAFLLKWKDHYPEDRLLCLARVFTNMEFMGCRYSTAVMHEVAKMSADIAKKYRSEKKNKLQRTFVSASDAAIDRAKGIKRQGGTIVASPQKKPTNIMFIPQGHDISFENNSKEINNSNIRLVPTMNGSNSQRNNEELMKNESTTKHKEERSIEITERIKCNILYGINYMMDISQMECLDPRDFNESMLNTPYGKFVFVLRPWNDVINNLHSSCANVKMPMTQGYKKGVFTVTLNNQVLVAAAGDKSTSRATACRLIWDKFRHNTVILLIKEPWKSGNAERISMTDIAGKKQEFGEPIEQSVALKMMKMMGWEGGGLGADSQGIAEPIKPNLRMVRRAGLGHEASGGLHVLKRAGLALMRRRGIALDADLVFAADFTMEERAVLHQCASQCGLMSKSYGKGEDRFLVVTNKLRPLSLVRDVVDCGGETAKYRVFIPAAIANSITEIKNKD